MTTMRFVEIRHFRSHLKKTREEFTTELAPLNKMLEQNNIDKDLYELFPNDAGKRGALSLLKTKVDGRPVNLSRSHQESQKSRFTGRNCPVSTSKEPCRGGTCRNGFEKNPEQAMNRKLVTRPRAEKEMTEVFEWAFVTIFEIAMRSQKGYNEMKVCGKITGIN